MSSIGASPPLAPGSVTVPATVAVAQVTEPSLSFDVGALIKAVVKARNNQGQLVVATNRGDILVTTPLLLPSGAPLTLQVRAVQDNLLTVTLLVEGRSPPKSGTESVHPTSTPVEKSVGPRISVPSVMTAHSVFSGTITSPATSGSAGALLGPVPDILTQAGSIVSGRQTPATHTLTTPHPITSNVGSQSFPLQNTVPSASAYQNTAGQAPVGQISTGQAPASPIPTGQILTAPVPAVQTPAGQASAAPMPTGPTPAGQFPAGQTSTGPIPTVPISKSGSPIHPIPTSDHSTRGGYPARGSFTSSGPVSAHSTSSNPVPPAVVGQARLVDRSDPLISGHHASRHGLSFGTTPQATSPAALLARSGDALRPMVAGVTQEAPGRAVSGPNTSVVPSHVAGSISGTPSIHALQGGIPAGALPSGDAHTSNRASPQFSGPPTPASPNIENSGNRVSANTHDHIARNPIPQDPLSQKPAFENRVPGNPVSGNAASGNPIASGTPGPSSGSSVIQNTGALKTVSPGVRLDFRLIALDTQGVPPAALLHHTARTLPAGSTLISGVVLNGGSGVTGNQTGTPTRILTPVGTVSLDGKVSLPARASVVLQIVRALPPDDGAEWVPPSLSFEEVSRGQWPGLKEAVSTLLASDGAAILDRMTPSPGPRLAGLMLLFITALRGGDVKGWLGEDGQNILAQKVGTTALQRLREDFNRFGQFLAETQPDDWRFFILPIYDGREDHLMHWRVRHHAKHSNKEDQDETRFVIDLTLSRLGDMQFDGFLKERQFDLVIRTRRLLSHRIQRDIRALYTNAQHIAGFHGDILFHVTEKFIQPHAKKLPEGAPHSDLRV